MLGNKISEPKRGMVCWALYTSEERRKIHFVNEHVPGTMGERVTLFFSPGCALAGVDRYMRPTSLSLARAHPSKYREQTRVTGKKGIYPKG